MYFIIPVKKKKSFQIAALETALKFWIKWQTVTNVNTILQFFISKYLLIFFIFFHNYKEKNRKPL